MGRRTLKDSMMIVQKSAGRTVPVGISRKGAGACASAARGLPGRRRGEAGRGGEPTVSPGPSSKEFSLSGIRKSRKIQSSAPPAEKHQRQPSVVGRAGRRGSRQERNEHGKTEHPWIRAWK